MHDGTIVATQPNHATVFEAEFDDDDTVAHLLEYCAEVGRPPREVIAGIVRDVLIDDARAHSAFRHKLN